MKVKDANFFVSVINEPVLNTNNNSSCGKAFCNQPVIEEWDCWEELELEGLEELKGIAWSHIENEKDYLLCEMIEKNPEYADLISDNLDDYELFILPTSNYNIKFILKRN